MVKDIIEAYSNIVPCKSCPFAIDCDNSDYKKCQDYLRELAGELPREAIWKKLPGTKWDEYLNSYECERCKAISPAKYNFCPFCGAKMKDRR